MFAHSLNRSTRHRLLVCLFLLTGLLALDVGVRSVSAQRPDSIANAKEMTARGNTAPAPQVERKSPNRAQLYSLGGTVVPTVVGAKAGDAELGATLVFLGLGLGPSLGHLYADNTDQALVGIGIRVGGGALGALGAAAALNSILDEDSGGGAGSLLLIGGLTVLMSGGYDIYTAGDAAREYNEAHGLSVQAAPTVGPRGEQVGLALQVSF
jgi:hypothetical protein